MNRLLVLDHLAGAWVVSHRLVAFDGPMWFLSAIGRGGLVWLASAAVFSMRERSPRLLRSVAFAVALASVVANQLIKPLVGRDRPFEQPAAARVIGGRPDDASFPSGHAANSFAGALVLSGAGRSAWWALAAGIVDSRVYLGVHYPLDVCGGALVGLLCGMIALRIERVIERFHDSRRPSQ